MCYGAAAGHQNQMSRINCWNGEFSTYRVVFFMAVFHTVKPPIFCMFSQRNCPILFSSIRNYKIFHSPGVSNLGCSNYIKSGLYIDIQVTKKSAGQYKYLTVVKDHKL
jgi:hypothetical protein